MAIQMRRGPLANYDKSKMLPGEWGISIDNDSDNQKAFISFAPGVSKEVMMVEDAEEQIAVATAEAIDMATEEAKAWAHGNSFHVNDYASGDGSTKSFTLAETPSSIIGVYVDGSSVSSYTLSGKTITFTTAPTSGSNNIRVYYTVNTTTDNAKYYLEQAEAVAESIPEDYSDLSDDVDQLKNALITDSASGSIASFPDGGDGFAVRDLKVQMEPIQDLHGYDHPWPEGGGKNLLPLNVDTIKTKNGGVSAWNGNSYTTSGLTFTLNVDDAGNLQKITVNGTATADTIFNFIQDASVSINATVIVTIPNASKGGFKCDGTWVDLRITSTTIENVSVVQALWVQFLSGRTYNNADISPMICLASATGPTVFAPYSNICPISGRDSVTVTRTGKNLLENTAESSTIRGVTFTVNADGSVMANGTASQTIWFYIKRGLYLKAGTYTLSGTPANMPNGCYLYDDASFNGWLDNGSGITKTFDTDVTGDIALRVNGGATLNNKVFYPMIESGSTATTYEPYTAQTVEIPLGQTVYGGTLDVTTGVLTVDRACVTLDGSNDEIWGDYVSNYGGYRLEIPDSKIDGVPKVQLKSNMYVGADSRSVTYPIIMGIMETYLSPSDDKYVFFTTNITTKADWLTWLGNNNVELTYPLANPITVQLTAQQLTTLLGQNNVWSDADSVAVDYVADTKLYIAKAIADALS